MFVGPSQKLAVRSNCTPAVTLMSAVNTTLAQGPGQPAGGVKSKGTGSKLANSALFRSWTTQGVVDGRGISGSAVTVLDEPITYGPDAKATGKASSRNERSVDMRKLGRCIENTERASSKEW